MKSFEDFRQEQQQDLEEGLPLLGLGSAAKWLGGKAIGDAIWGAVKGTAKGGAGLVKKGVGEVVKTGKKAWDGGDTEIKGVKGSDEKGLPSSN